VRTRLSGVTGLDMTLAQELIDYWVLRGSLWPAETQPLPPASALLERRTGATYNTGTLNRWMPAAASTAVDAPVAGQLANQHRLRERSI